MARPPDEPSGLDDRLDRIRGKVRREAAALERLAWRQRQTAAQAQAVVDLTREKRRWARGLVGPPRQRPSRDT